MYFFKQLSVTEYGSGHDHFDVSVDHQEKDDRDQTCLNCFSWHNLKDMGLREAIRVKTPFSLSRQIVLLSLFLYSSVLSSWIVITHSLCRGLEWMCDPTMSLIGW